SDTVDVDEHMIYADELFRGCTATIVRTICQLYDGKQKAFERFDRHHDGRLARIRRASDLAPVNYQGSASLEDERPQRFPELARPTDRQDLGLDLVQILKKTFDLVSQERVFNGRLDCFSKVLNQRGHCNSPFLWDSHLLIVPDLSPYYVQNQPDLYRLCGARGGRGRCIIRRRFPGQTGPSAAGRGGTRRRLRRGGRAAAGSRKRSGGPAAARPADRGAARRRAKRGELRWFPRSAARPSL